MNNLLKTSVGVTAILCIGYAVSFLKESVIANFFGATSAVDAYTISLQVPVILFAFVAVALRSIVIPIYTDLYYNTEREKSTQYINSLLNLVLLFSILITVVIFIFSKYIILLFAPGFNQDTNALASTLLKILCPTILTSLAGNIITSVLNVHNKFIWPSIGVLILNTILIVTILILHSKFGIISAALGQFFGCCLELLFLIFLVRKHMIYRFYLEWKNPHLIKSLKMSVPVIWSTSLAEVTAMSGRIVASFLFVGSIAILNYASKINSIFISLFTSAIATIIYPIYAKSSALNDFQGLNTKINKTLSIYVLFLLPVTAIIWCLKREIIEIAFARGQFNLEDVERTQILLGWYSIGLVFMGFRESLTKVFYSLKDSKTPAINASIGFIITIILNLTLPLFLGVQGLAISVSITAIVISTGLFVRLKKRYKEINTSYLIKNITSISIITIFVSLFTMIIKFYLDELNIWWLCIICGLSFFILYLIGLMIFKPKIWGDLLLIIKK